MVRGEQQAVVALAAQVLVERADDLFVDLLEGFDFFFDLAFVRGFVGCLDVDDNEVVIGQRGDPGSAFGEAPAEPVRATDVGALAARQEPRPSCARSKSPSPTATRSENSLCDLRASA